MEEEVSMEQLKSSGNLVVGVGLSLGRPSAVPTDPLEGVNRSEQAVKTYSKSSATSANSTRPTVLHMHIKSEEEPDQKSLIELCHKCPVCLFSSSCLKNWREHLKCKHLQNIEYLSCPYQCGYNSHLNDMVDHIFCKHKNARLIPCNKCFFFTSSKDKLSEHIRASHTVKCTDTQFVVDNPSSLENDVKAIHSEEDKESKAFHLTAKDISLDDSFASHNLKYKPNILRTSFKPKKHTCFELNGKLNFVCLSCPFTAPNPLLLDSHMSEEHEGQRYSFNCPTCDFETTHADSMVSHFKKTHKPNSNLQCIYCDFIAVSESEISTHILEHIYASTPKREGNEFPESKFKSKNECKISENLPTESDDDEKSFDLKKVLKMPDQKESMKFDFDNLEFNEESQSKDPLAISDSNPVDSSNAFKKECKRSSSDAPFDVVDLNKLLHKRLKLTPSDHIIEIDEASKVVPEGNPKTPLILSPDETAEIDEASKVLPEENPQTLLTSPPETECIIIDSDEEEEIPDDETPKLSLQVIHLNEEERAVLSSNFSDEDVQNPESDCTVFRIVESEGEVQVENVSEKLKSTSPIPQLMMIENMKYYDDNCLASPNLNGENVIQLENEPIVSVDTNVESSMQPLCSKPPKLSKETDKSASSSFVSASSLSKSTSTIPQFRRNLSQKNQKIHSTIVKKVKNCSKDVEEPISAVKGKVACHSIETELNLSSISSPDVVDLESESKPTSDISQIQKIKEVNGECSTDVTCESENRLKHIKTLFSGNLLGKEVSSTQGGRNETSKLELTSATSPSQSRSRLKPMWVEHGSSITHKRTPASVVACHSLETELNLSSISSPDVVDLESESKPTSDISQIQKIKEVNGECSTDVTCESENRLKHIKTLFSGNLLGKEVSSTQGGRNETSKLELTSATSPSQSRSRLKPIWVKHGSSITHKRTPASVVVSREEGRSTRTSHTNTKNSASSVVDQPTISYSLKIKDVKKVMVNNSTEAKCEDQKREKWLTRTSHITAHGHRMNPENSVPTGVAPTNKHDLKPTSTITHTLKIKNVKQINETYLRLENLLTRLNSANDDPDEEDSSIQILHKPSPQLESTGILSPDSVDLTSESKPASTISHSLEIKDVRQINGKFLNHAKVEDQTHLKGVHEPLSGIVTRKEACSTQNPLCKGIKFNMNTETSASPRIADAKKEELKPTSIISDTPKIRDVKQTNVTYSMNVNCQEILSGNVTRKEAGSTKNPLCKALEFQINAETSASPRIADAKKGELNPTSTFSDTPKIRDVTQTNETFSTDFNCQEILSGNVTQKKACSTQASVCNALEFKMNAENSATPRIADAKKGELNPTSTFSDTPTIRDVKQTNESYSTDVNCQEILSGNVRRGRERLTETDQILSPELRRNREEESAPPITSPGFPVSKMKTLLARADIPGPVVRQDNLFRPDTLQKAIDSCIEKKLDQAVSSRGGSEVLLTSPQVSCTLLKDAPDSQSQSVNWTALCPPKNQGNGAPRQSEEPILVICSFCFSQFPTPSELKQHIFANHLEQYLHRSAQKLKRPSDVSMSETSQDGKKQKVETSRSPHIQPNSFNKKEDGAKTDSMTCPHCLISLSSKQMDQHIFRMHPQHYPFPCFKCKKRFVSLEERREHNQTVHMSCCPDCKFKTSAKNKYLKHLEEKHLKYTCKSCSRKYLFTSCTPKVNNSFLQLSCTECSYATNNFNDLKSHTIAHQERKASGKQAKTCHLCGVEE